MAVLSAADDSYASRDPDVRLMLRVRDNDAAAFEELVTRYQARVVSVLRRQVTSPEQVEDLAQEVFLRIFRARQRYEPQAKFATWLFTIVNNVASNANRSAARRKEVHLTARAASADTPPQLDQLALAASGLMPTRVLDKSERAEVVRMAIEALSERQRMALMLAKFEEMSYAEIGEVMGMSAKATKSLLARARENLRIMLEPYMADGTRPGAQEAEDDA